MSVTVPDDVAWVLNILGFMWPEADEDKLRMCAQAWRDFGSELGRINRDAHLAAAQVTAENRGDSIDAFEKYWQGIGGSGGDFTRAAEAADHMAVALDGMALLVEGVKLAIIAQLVLLAAEIVADQVAAPETLGLSEGAAVAEVIVTRGIVRRIVQEGVHRVAREIVQGLKGRVLEIFRKILATALRRAVAGAVIAGGSDLGKQELDIYVFHSRTKLDFQELAGTTAGGAVIGAIAPGPKRDLSHADRGDGRDPSGRFTGNGGYGKSGEAKGLADYEHDYGRPVIKDQVRASFSDGTLGGRYYDGLSLKPDGTYEGVEIKSNDAERDAHQRAFDRQIESGTPATAQVNGKTIKITSVQVIRVEE